MSSYGILKVLGDELIAVAVEIVEHRGGDPVSTTNKDEITLLDSISHSSCETLVVNLIRGDVPEISDAIAVNKY